MVVGGTAPRKVVGGVIGRPGFNVVRKVDIGLGHNNERLAKLVLVAAVGGGGQARLNGRN
jgi:hypothetical protein